MKSIYIVATEVPSLRGGAPVRNLNLIIQYVSAGYDVSVFCLFRPKDNDELERLKYIKTLKVYPVPLQSFSVISKVKAILINRVPPFMSQYRDSNLSKKLTEICKLSLPDYVQVEQLNAYYAIIPALDGLHGKSIIILDAHNVEQKALRDGIKMFNPIKKLIGYYILPRFSKLENNASLSVDAVLCCSYDDATFFRNIGCSQVIEVPNGVDCSYYRIETHPLTDTLLFMGGTTYPPNEDALKWYFANIHDLVKQKRPQLKFFIIGSKPPKWLLKLALNDKSIVLPGYVDDVRKYIKLSSVCISPMRGGSGTSLKILEYMASSKAVVTTTFGVRGIKYTDGYDIMIADDAIKFANSIVMLMNSKELNIRVSKQARDLMLSSYEWSVIFTNLNQQLELLTLKNNHENI